MNYKSRKIYFPVFQGIQEVCFQGAGQGDPCQGSSFCQMAEGGRGGE